MKKRYEYGVSVDMLHGKVAKALQERVNDVRKQVETKGYKPLDECAVYAYASAMQYINQYGMKPGTKMPSVKGKRFHLLASARGVMFLTYTLKAIDSDATAALSNGTPIFVFRPYATPDMVRFTSIGEWREAMQVEAESHKQFAINMDYVNWQKELQYSLTAVLNTPIPWINKEWRLHTLAKQYPSFDAFMTYVHATIADIEAKGEWDIEVTASLVMNEKASVATYVATKGENKGLRTSYSTDKTEYWMNYEVLTSDILTKFLHLTYLDSIGYKPLKRIMTDGVDFDGKELWFGDAQEDMLRTTPLYVDPYQEHEKVEDFFTGSGKIDMGTFSKVVDVDTLRALGYDAAKVLLKKLMK